MVGTLVKSRRVARGLTQAELAQRTGLRQTYISQIEKGEIALPREHNLDALGAALGISRAEFYQEAGMFEGLPAPPRGDIFDRAPVGLLVAELHRLPVSSGPSFADQLDILARMTPAVQERAIRNIARDFLVTIQRELERELEREREDNGAGAGACAG